MHAFIRNYDNAWNTICKEREKIVGGMQSESEQEKYTIEMKALIRLCSDVMEEEELKKQLEETNGNVSMVIEKMVSTLLNQNAISATQDSDLQKKSEQTKHTNEKVVFFFFFTQTKDNEAIKSNEGDEIKSNKLKKEEEKVEIGEIKSGINLQGYCVNEDCLASKAKLPVWVNIGFGDISFVSNKTSHCCPDCKQSTVTTIMRVMIFNSEHSICASDNSIPVKDNHYQCFYSIKLGLSYEIKAKKIRQHATSLEDLITRSENAMMSNEVINLITELQKYLITVVKPQKVKDSIRLQEKIKCDYSGDYNQ
ncbi:hypothetical protein RFI_03538, partial [Reticulomyxa filosa]